MPKKTEASRQRVRSIASLVACTVLGVIFLIAGTGKIFAFGEMPGQTMQFIGAILPDAWLTPGVALFLGDIFFPYIIPWTELCLGILLLLRIWPRLFAALSLPLIVSFLINNAWYISQGEELDPCPCIGIWAKIFGTPTHLQALWIDIVLLALALTVIFVHPGGFLSSPPWLAKLGKSTKGKDKRK
ncbi:MAG: DoxX family membrane protein [Chloroflexota bacterium]|nr:MAG: DoxX family membrane protein [Chloroflexota bacterium]